MTAEKTVMREPVSMSELVLEAVGHSFDGHEVLTNLNLCVSHGEFVALVGPSGCGKTTLLNLLAGNLQPTRGQVTRRGQTRTVYQQDGLFPWLTVSENIELGLRSVADAARRAAEIRAMVHLIRLEGFERHYPHQLSGGMKQRVELARALAGQSEVLLMDEPFSALDYQTRIRMRRELAGLLMERPRTVVFVTHDILEAAQLADRVLVLAGRPATVSREIRIETPRPRSATHPEVVETVRVILEELGLEETGPNQPAGVRPQS